MAQAASLRHNLVAGLDERRFLVDTGDPHRRRRGERTVGPGAGRCAGRSRDRSGLLRRHSYHRSVNALRRNQTQSA